MLPCIPEKFDIGRSLAVLPIIVIGRLVLWYRPIVVYTIGKYKFLFLLIKVNKHESDSVSAKSGSVL